ncbi:hypothetical protein FB563_2706 [Streptomyces puniciscabiei]|uniref:Uncharacterized protein n=1 Tax=Streptomyces puniciscabiei TaxID=164348 RepID=A0A542UF80_9ACTN|nr:hypothetical protein [Streptomyces puniciscabiei]TQK97722.1 hypothetical protein FB563_2706 [Streptomyces puniciscabiei]
MDSTGEPMDAQQAERALAAARAAQCAARTAGDERNRPRWYAIAQGLTCAPGFIALGLAEKYPQWGAWPAVAGGLSLAAFLVLVWLGAHHGGVTGWFSRDCGSGRRGWRAWVVPLLPCTVAFLAYLLYGPAAWLIAMGLASGIDYLLRATRQGRTA